MEPEGIIARKTALICMGGGMRSAHGAGFLYALATKLNITTPDLLVGTSGAAGTVTYFASRQYDCIKEVWCERLTNPRFVSFSRLWKIIDIDYLVNTIFRFDTPLNLEKLAQAPNPCLIPLTDAHTGITTYMDIRTSTNPFAILEAAKAIPVFYGKHTQIDGRSYIDGEIGPTLDDHVQFCADQGATHIIVINDATPMSRMSRLLKTAFALFQPKPMRTAMLHDFHKNSFVCSIGPGATQVFCVFPGKLPYRFLTTSKEKIRAAFALGERNADKYQKDIVSFLAS